jgi:hypothetical protein
MALLMICLKKWRGVKVENGSGGGRRMGAMKIGICVDRGKAGRGMEMDIF